MALPTTLQILEIKNLSLILNHKTVLSNVSLEVREGCITSLLGKSGSGKSTLFKTILGYQKEYLAYQGEILFKGGRLTSKDRRNIQPVFQEPLLHFNPNWTLYQVLSEPLDLQRSFSFRDVVKSGIKQIPFIHFGIYEGMDEINLSRIIPLLEELNFKDLSILNKNITEFSGGELQRFAIIRALLCNPRIILMDEPFSAMDAIVQRDFLYLIQSLVATHNVTVLFISHDLDIVRDLSDYIYVIDQGKIIEKGKKDKIFLKSKSAVFRELIDSRNLEDIRGD